MVAAPVNSERIRQILFFLSKEYVCLWGRKVKVGKFRVEEFGRKNKESKGVDERRHSSCRDITKMKRKEKKERFHDALLHMLYPPPPPPEEVGTKDPPGISVKDVDLYSFPDEWKEKRGSPSSSCADEGESDGFKKLTRSQRKRIRKKKLKEAASSRRKIIGPVLPFVKNQPEGVRENAPKTLDAEIQEPESGNSISSGLKETRTNRRRKAKKLDGVKLSSATSSSQDHGKETLQNETPL